jgi:GNAT superfamily N-acetyltransferase
MIRLATISDAPALGEVLHDAVAGGASVNFMHPFSLGEATQKYEQWLLDPGRVVLAWVGETGRIDGTAQLMLDTPPNQPHRAELAKMLVHRRARRQGIAARLFQAVCDEARRRGRWLVTFDTMTGGEAERVYTRCGAVKIGEYPDYAYWPEGDSLGASSFFYIRLK